MPGTNRSVMRAFSILKAFAAEDEWISASEISRRAALPFASTHRFLQTLEQTGAVHKGDGGSYRLGYLIASLSQNVNIDDCLNQASHDLISALSRKLDASIFLGRLQGKAVILSGKAFASPWKHKFLAALTQIPAPNLALGRVLLADLSLEDIDRAVEGQWTGALSTQSAGKSELIAELARIRRQGFALEKELTYPSLGSVAVPVRDNDGRVFAALSASEESEKLTPERIGLLRSELQSLEPMLRRRILPESSVKRSRGGDFAKRGGDIRQVREPEAVAKSLNKSSSGRDRPGRLPSL